MMSIPVYGSLHRIEFSKITKLEKLSPKGVGQINHTHVQLCYL